MSSCCLSTLFKKWPTELAD